MIIIIKDKDFQHIPKEYQEKLFETFRYLCIQAEKFLSDPGVTIDASFSILHAVHEGVQIIFKIDFIVDLDAVIITHVEPITKERYDQLTIAREAAEQQFPN